MPHLKMPKGSSQWRRPVSHKLYNHGRGGGGGRACIGAVARCVVHLPPKDTSVPPPVFTPAPNALPPTHPLLPLQGSIAVPLDKVRSHSPTTPAYDLWAALHTRQGPHTILGINAGTTDSTQWQDVPIWGRFGGGRGSAGACWGRLESQPGPLYIATNSAVFQKNLP